MLRRFYLMQIENDSVWVLDMSKPVPDGTKDSIYRVVALCSTDEAERLGRMSDGQVAEAYRLLLCPAVI